MKKFVFCVLIALIFISAARAQVGITFFPGPGMTSSGGGGGCAAPNGQMDFSFCSNVGITAAVMP